LPQMIIIVHGTFNVTYLRKLEIKGYIDKTKWTVSQREIDDLLSEAVTRHFKDKTEWVHSEQGWSKGSDFFRITMHGDVFFFELWEIDFEINLLKEFKILKLDAASLEQVLFSMRI
jgi:hypothetical protein